MHISKTLFAGLALVLATHAPSAMAAKSGDIFKDWQYVCETAEEGQEVCHISQGLASTEDKKPVLHIAIGYLPSQSKPAAIITLPLGLALRPGVQIRIDEGEPQRLQPNVCLPAGCQTIVVIDDDMLQQMKKGSSLYVAFYTLASKEPHSVRVSLSGFSAAFKELKPAF